MRAVGVPIVRVQLDPLARMQKRPRHPRRRQPQQALARIERAIENAATLSRLVTLAEFVLLNGSSWFLNRDPQEFSPADSDQGANIAQPSQRSTSALMSTDYWCSARARSASSPEHRPRAPSRRLLAAAGSVVFDLLADEYRRFHRRLAELAVLDQRAGQLNCLGRWAPLQRLERELAFVRPLGNLAAPCGTSPAARHPANRAAGQCASSQRRARVLYLWSLDAIS